MIIPAESLSDEARQGLIDDYCMREAGLDDLENPLGNCREAVAQALASGRLVVMLTPDNPNQIASLVPAELAVESEGASE